MGQAYQRAAIMSSRGGLTEGGSGLTWHVLIRISHAYVDTRIIKITETALDSILFTHASASQSAALQALETSSLEMAW